METDIVEVGWTREQIWRGSILASIAHAIMVAHFPEIANEHSWDGMNYSVQDSAGTRGTVTFHPQYCVAAFRNEQSNRMTTGETNAEKHFKGAPPPIIALAEVETLQYLLDNINGDVSPVITTAFWGVNHHIVTNDEYESMIENGGFILETHVLDLGAAIDAWVEYYGMNEKQIILMKSIYERKVSNPRDVIRLTDVEGNMIGSEKPEGLIESKISFEEIGVLV